ncbi:MAG: hypothetical protein Tsb0013_13620 [Phycisphaerales bacterium]
MHDHSQSSSADARRHDRREYQSWLDIAILDEDMVCTQVICTPSADVSAGGCGIMSAEPYEPGIRVVMRFKSPDERLPPVLRWGTVRHCRRLSKQGWCMVGFEFLALDAEPLQGFGWREGERVTAGAHADERRAA